MQYHSNKITLLFQWSNGITEFKSQSCQNFPRPPSRTAHLEKRRADDGADALDDDVEEGSHEADLSRDQHARRHSRVDVASTDVADAL